VNPASFATCDRRFPGKVGAFWCRAPMVRRTRPFFEKSIAAGKGVSEAVSSNFALSHMVTDPGRSRASEASERIARAVYMH